MQAARCLRCAGRACLKPASSVPAVFTLLESRSADTPAMNATELNTASQAAREEAGERKPTQAAAVAAGEQGGRQGQGRWSRPWVRGRWGRREGRRLLHPCRRGCAEVARGDGMQVWSPAQLQPIAHILVLSLLLSSPAGGTDVGAGPEGGAIAAAEQSGPRVPIHQGTGEQAQGQLAVMQGRVQASTAAHL
ncbi:hypothetical protein ABPG75_012276 [Micractinium tetrahymenae]